MAVNVYEGMFILDSGRYGRNPGEVSGQISEMVEAIGGEVLASRLWEERRLAYPIAGVRKGTYWLTYFRAEGQKLVELNRQSELNDNILRSLVLKVDDRIVDALVQHALAGDAKPEAADAEGKSEGEAEPAKTADTASEAS